MSESDPNKENESNLCDAYLKSKRRNIRLPDPRYFRLSSNLGKARLSLAAEAVVRNMQDDVAAFEGWLLALKAWGCIENAELHWDAPEKRNDGHYQRFLYRVTQFEKLFGWFEVVRECRVLLGESRVKGSLFVNTAAGTPKVNPDEKSKETKLEKYLADSGWLSITFALDKDKVGRQFPVGLFENTVSQKTKIFTGGKSAIDLVGLEHKAKRVWVFELKAEGNQSMGIVSELFFYVAFMRDAIMGTFKFKDSERCVDGRLHHRDLELIEEIRGCLLAPKFHPLLDDNLVVDLLNNAVWPDGLKVGFCSEKLPDAIVAQAAA